MSPPLGVELESGNQIALPGWGNQDSEVLAAVSPPQGVELTESLGTRWLTAAAKKQDELLEQIRKARSHIMLPSELWVSISDLV